MAKNRLNVAYDFDFDLIAINAPVKEYKLAWAMNQNMGLNLAKQENVNLDFSRGKLLSISNFICKTQHQVFQLLKNRTDSDEDQLQAFLLPEMKHFDYFMKVVDDSSTFDINPFISSLKQIPFVQFAIKVDIAVLKSKDNLIF